MSTAVKLNLEAVKQLLPHRYPFLFIDQVIELEKMKYCLAQKNISGLEPYFAGHFPKNPIFPGVYQIEAIAQTAGIALSYQNDYPGIPVLAKVNSARFRRKVVPGDILLIKAEIINLKSSIAIVKGVIKSYNYKQETQIVSDSELILSIGN